MMWVPHRAIYACYSVVTTTAAQSDDLTYNVASQALRFGLGAFGRLGALLLASIGCIILSA